MPEVFEKDGIQGRKFNLKLPGIIAASKKEKKTNHIYLGVVTITSEQLVLSSLEGKHLKSEFTL